MLAETEGLEASEKFIDKLRELNTSDHEDAELSVLVGRYYQFIAGALQSQEYSEPIRVKLSTVAADIPLVVANSFVCIICGKDAIGYGHNPEPLKKFQDGK
jgi:hypothetical protein